MERHFDDHLQALKYHLMKMSAMAEVMISDAIKAVVEADGWRRASVAGAAANLDRWLNLAATDHEEVVDLIARISRSRGGAC